MEQRQPDLNDPGVAIIEPGIHRIEYLTMKLSEHNFHTLYFKPGMHHVEQVLVNIPSGKQIYLAGGAFVAGSFVCDKSDNISIYGRGAIYLSEFGRFSAFRGVRLMYAKNIEIDGISVIDPPHYSVYIGQSEQVRIRDFVSFSTRGWSDGIDMMSSCDIEIEDVFMRNSDDCIAIYGHRWGYYGDSRNITVRNSILWADVAHPTMIGVHGEHTGDGDVIENIRFENIDILEHHEPQDGYQGCLTINAGDKNTVCNVTYNDIRIEPFELGRIIDLRVMWNKDYNPEPGNRIENIHFRNICYSGSEEVESRIIGFDAERVVDGVIIEDFYVNERKVTDAVSGNIRVGEYAHNVTFRT
jgi:polygalacturonase